MGTPRMLPLVTVANGFQARVLAARFGAAGILVQLRGAVDGPYPLGDVGIDVAEDDLDAARELLLADEVESAFEHDSPRRSARRIAPWVLVGAAMLAEAVTVAVRVS